MKRNQSIHSPIHSSIVFEFICCKNVIFIVMDWMLHEASWEGYMCNLVMFVTCELWFCVWRKQKISAFFSFWFCNILLWKKLYTQLNSCLFFYANDNVNIWLIFYRWFLVWLWMMDVWGMWKQRQTLWMIITMIDFCFLVKNE